MGPRPQPNPVRGLLRAAIVVLALVAVILVALIALQTLYAPPAKAPAVPPTVPPTPGARATPRLLPTPRTSKTPGKKKSLGLLLRRGDSAVAEQGPARVFAQLVPGSNVQWPANATASPDRHVIAWFQGNDAYHARLLLTVPSSGVTQFAAYGDPLIRPVWSRDGRRLLFARAAQTAAFPGARWSLVQLDTATRRSTVLAQADALSLVPLGWSAGRVLYLVGTAADTSVFVHTAQGNRDLSIVLNQPVIAASLSPNGRFIATTSPTNCYDSCSLLVFDGKKLTTWYGPSGIARESDIAWTADSHHLLTDRLGTLAATDVIAHTTRALPMPQGLPVVWDHPMHAFLSQGEVSLQDGVDGTIYRGRR